jgi:hypothetical protein
MLELRNSLCLSKYDNGNNFSFISDKTLTQIKIYSSIHLGAHYTLLNSFCIQQTLKIVGNYFVQLGSLNF